MPRAGRRVDKTRRSTGGALRTDATSLDASLYVERKANPADQHGFGEVQRDDLSLVEEYKGAEHDFLSINDTMTRHLPRKPVSAEKNQSEVSKSMSATSMTSPASISAIRQDQSKPCCRLSREPSSDKNLKKRCLEDLANPLHVLFQRISDNSFIPEMQERNAASHPPEDGSDSGVDPKHADDHREWRKQNAKYDGFFIDTTGSGLPIETGFSLPKIERPLSPTLSNSSDEVITFSGRNKSRTGVVNERSPLFPQVHDKRTCFSNLVDPLYEDTQLATSNFTPTAGSLTRRKIAVHDKIDKTSNTKRGKIKCGQRSQRSDNAEAEAQIVSDYIANMRAEGDMSYLSESTAFVRRDLGATDGLEDENQEQALDLSEQLFRTDLQSSESCESAAVWDCDETRMSSETVNIISKDLSKREKESSIQKFGARNGGLSNAVFDKQQAQSDPSLDVTNRVNSYPKNDHAASDLRRKFSDGRDSSGSNHPPKPRVDDEQIARLLSKQEELGMGSNNLILFDGVEVEREGSQEYIEPSLMLPTKSRKCATKEFPSASSFAQALELDPYNGFDVMDQDRPSLRKRPKGRQGKLPVELSDSELERSIFNSWENDRSKKKARKQEREELRAEGLLGKKKKLDLKAKYSEGMSVSEVKQEIRKFLVASAESLPLPPMAQKERKMVHQIANAFLLKSKSIGGGKSRFPILYKTARTKRYDEDAFHLVDSDLTTRKFLPRQDRSSRRAAVPVGRNRGGRLASAGVSYRDGEVVGATAPELGQENKGRAMLEKMGWSTGTALGALNNKGIPVPVSQIVKTTRAGLG